MNQIDKIICINLTTRKDREIRMKKIMAEQGLSFEFYKATPHDNPTQGCKESHLAVIQLAKDRGYDNILVLEDDIDFCKPVIDMPAFPKETEWDMLYLGGLMIPPFNETDLKEGKPWIRGSIFCCQSYIVNKSAYDKILYGPLDKFKEIDTMLANTVHREGKTYMVADIITKQIGGWSDLEKRYKWIDYKWPVPGNLYNMP